MYASYYSVSADQEKCDGSSDIMMALLIPVGWVGFSHNAAPGNALALYSHVTKASD
jgi:hypothetical protein